LKKFIPALSVQDLYLLLAQSAFALSGGINKIFVQREGFSGLAVFTFYRENFCSGDYFLFSLL